MSYLSRIRIRWFLSALGFSGAVLAPAWVPLVAMVLLALRYSAWEILGIGLLVDLLWRAAGVSFAHLPLFTLIALILVWGLEPLRSEFLT